MAQIVSLLDSYAYRSMVWDVFVERLRRPLSGGTPDEDRVNAGLNQADLCLMVLSNFLGDGAWLAGEDLSLADLHAAPMVCYLRATSEGRKLLERYSAMAAWWARIVTRSAMRATATPYAADV